MSLCSMTQWVPELPVAEQLQINCSRQALEEGRIFWSAFATILERLPFLPITINIPDLLYGAAEMFYSVFQYFGGGGGGGSSDSPRHLFLFLDRLLSDGNCSLSDHMDKI